MDESSAGNSAAAHVLEHGESIDTSFLERLESFNSALEEQLLNRFAPPTKSEISQTSYFIEECDRRLPHIEAEFLRLQDIRDRHRKSYEQAKELLKGLAAPIRRLPVEVLGEIFFLAVDYEIAFEGDFALSTTRTALHISQVCRLWREVTKFTPRMWASRMWSINLNFNTSRKELISHYLERSKAVPLALDIRGHGSASMEILKLFLRHSIRWRLAILAFDGATWRTLDAELRSRPEPEGGHFPALEHISLQLTSSYDIFSLAPKLSSLTAYRLEYSSKLPFSQIKSAQVTVAGASELRVLRQIDAVEKLLLRVENTFGQSQALPTYSALSELDLQCCDVGMYSWAFRTLALPSLKALLIRPSKYEPIEWPLEDFKLMISRCASSLETFHLLGSILMTSGQLKETLRRMPTLKELKVDSPISKKTDIVALLDLLTIDPGMVQDVEQLTLRCLKRFELKIYVPLDEDLADHFAGMVRSRQKSLMDGVDCLSDFRFFAPGSLAGEVVPASVSARLQNPSWRVS